MSHDKLFDLARFGLRCAENAGAQDARVTVTRSRQVRAEWRDGKLDRIRESTSQNLGMALYVDRRFSFNSSCDLRREALEKHIADCVGLTRYLAEDPHRKLPDPSRYEGMTTADLQLFDASVPELTADERLAEAQAMEEAVRTGGKSLTINSVETSVSDTTGSSVCVASNGFEGAEEGTTASRLIRFSIDAGDDRKPQAWAYATSRFLEDLTSTEAMAAEAVRRAKDQIGTRQVPTGRYEVIVENRSAPRLARYLVDAMYGWNIQQKSSFLEDRLGEQIAVPWLDVVSNPHVPRGLGSTAWDREGMATASMPMIEGGVFKNLFLNTYYASKLGMEPTSAHQGNLVWSEGSRSLEAMVPDVERGIVVTFFLGGNSNPTTGDFSLGVKGFLVENGRRVHPVSEVNMAGSHLELWKQLVEVGNDPWTHSGNRTPSLRFRDVQISGA